MDPKSLVPADDLPADVAPAAAPVNAEVPRDDLPEVPAHDLPDSQESPASKEDTYGGGLQQAVAGLEGAAQGIAGPLATLAETKLLGVNPEDISGRAEANPWTHGIGEAVGIGGSLVTGVGEAALIGKAAEAVSGAAKLGKIGSTALKGAIDAGLFQAGDETSKYILGQSDPEAPVSSALAHMGAAALLGGAGGVVLGKAGSKLQELAEGKIASKAAQNLADFGNRYEFRSTNKDLVGSATGEAQHLFNTVSSAIDDGFSLKRNSIDKLTQNIDPSVTGGYVNDMLHKLENAAPELVSDKGFQRELGIWKSKVAPETDIIGAQTKVPSAGDIFEATDDLKRKLQGFAKFEKRANDPNVEYFSRLAGNLSHDLRTSLENPKVWGEMGNFQKELNGAYGEMQNPLKDFMSAAMSKKEGVREIDPAKIASIFRSVSKEKPLTGFKADKVADFFEPAKKFLNTVDSLHTSRGLESSIPKVSTNTLSEMLNQDIPRAAKFADWFFDAGPGAIGWAGSHAAGTAVGAAIGHPYLGFRAGEHLYPMIKEMGMKPTRAAVGAVLRSLAAGSHDGIPQAVNYAEKIAKGAKAIDTSVDNLFTIGGQKYLNHDFSETSREALRKYVSEGTLNQQIDNQKSDGGGGKDMISPKPAFAHGGAVLAPEPTQPVAKPVGKAVPKNDHVATVFPEQSMLLGAAKGRINNYLNQIRPQAVQSKLPFDEHIKDKAKEKSYDRALDIANKPLSIMDHIKNGTLEPEHVQHMNQLYPELTNHLKKKITEKIVKAQMDNEKPPYKVRQSLSLFMGAPLDSNLTPQNIMAAQATFIKMAPPQAGKGQGTSTKGLGDVSNQFRTHDQAVQERQRRPK